MALKFSTPDPGGESCPMAENIQMKIRKILLATDFSACSWQSFAPAADLARRLGAFIELVNCLESPPDLPEADGSLDDLRRLHRRNLELQAEDPAFKGVPVTVYL